MIGQVAIRGGGSVSAATAIAATVSTAAIAAAVAGKDKSTVSAVLSFARPGFRLAPCATGNAEQNGNGGTRDEDHDNPEEYLAQILAPSAVDHFKGNQR